MTVRTRFAELRADAPLILPSLLLCDFGNLEKEIREVDAAGARALHLDIMDGHFVPNITYGFTIVETVRRITDLPLDVHLMISEPSRYVRRFLESGASMLTVHAEAVADPRPVLDAIRQQGAVAGLAFNPPTPVSVVEPALTACDFVLAMTVMPGYGGQQFDSSVLTKIRHLRELLPDEVPIEVDGGINSDTIATCTEAGASMFVTGSAIFRSEDYAASMAALREMASAPH